MEVQNAYKPNLDSVTISINLVIEYILTSKDVISNMNYPVLINAIIIVCSQYDFTNTSNDVSIKRGKKLELYKEEHAAALQKMIDTIMTILSKNKMIGGSKKMNGGNDDNKSGVTLQNGDIVRRRVIYPKTVNILWILYAIGTVYIFFMFVKYTSLTVLETNKKTINREWELIRRTISYSSPQAVAVQSALDDYKNLVGTDDNTILPLDNNNDYIEEYGTMSMDHLIAPPSSTDQDNSIIGEWSNHINIVKDLFMDPNSFGAKLRIPEILAAAQEKQQAVSSIIHKIGEIRLDVATQLAETAEEGGISASIEGIFTNFASYMGGSEKHSRISILRAQAALLAEITGRIVPLLQETTTSVATISTAATSIRNQVNNMWWEFATMYCVVGIINGILMGIYGYIIGKLFISSETFTIEQFADLQENLKREYLRIFREITGSHNLGLTNDQLVRMFKNVIERLPPMLTGDDAEKNNFISELENMLNESEGGTSIIGALSGIMRTGLFNGSLLNAIGWGIFPFRPKAITDANANANAITNRTDDRNPYAGELVIYDGNRNNYGGKAKKLTRKAKKPIRKAKKSTRKAKKPTRKAKKSKKKKNKKALI